MGSSVADSVRTRRAQEGLGSWLGDTELSEFHHDAPCLCIFVGKRKRPQKVVDLDGPVQDV